MKLRPEHIKELLSSSLSTEELALVYRYLRSNPEMLDEVFPEDEWLQETTHTPAADYNPQAVLDRIKNALHQPKPSIIRRIRPFYKVAAAAVLLLGIGILCWMITGKPIPGKTGTGLSIGSAGIVYTNNSGNNEIIQMADGSVLKLFPGASIKYNTGYGTTNRDIYLSGDGLFAVAHNTNLPFIVYSGNISTRAVGTLFSINYTDNKKTIRVKLLKGKVLVRNNNAKADSIYMDPGDYCVANTGKPLARIHSPGSQKIAAVKEVYAVKKPDVQKILSDIGDNRKFNLKNLPVATVLKIYEHLYQVSIDYQNLSYNKKLKNQYSCQVDLDRITIEQAIENLTAVNGLSWHKINEGHFRITAD